MTRAARTKLPRPASTNAAPPAALAPLPRDPLREAMFARLMLGAQLAAVDTMTARMEGEPKFLTQHVHFHPRVFAAELREGREGSVAFVRAAAEQCAAVAQRVAVAVVPRRYRNAVLARDSLAWRFPLSIARDTAPSAETDVAALLDRSVQIPGDPPIPGVAGVKTESWIPPRHSAELYGAEGPPIEACTRATLFIPWSQMEPPTITLQDVVDALRASPELEAREAARIILRVYQETPAPKATLADGSPVEASPAIPLRRELAAAGLTLWSPHAVAAALFALQEVKAGQRDARMFALPAHQASRVPFEIMGAGETYAAGELATVKRALSPTAPQRAGFRVVWNGDPRGEQFAFAFMIATGPQPAVFRDVLRELKAEGLRDYVILHRMASEQGRTGRLRWTWEHHKRATAHEARVRNSSARDDDARKATIDRILRLTSAELHAEVKEGARRAWKVIGAAPLVFVAGGIEHNGDIEGLELALNPALYEGARADGGAELRRYFTQLPEAVLSLPALAFSLGVMLGFRWRYASDGGGAVTLTGEELHAYMDAGRWRSGNKAAADATLRHALGEIAAAMGPGCAFEPVEGGGFIARPPHAWVDAVVHEVPPELPPSTAKLPRTGAELRAWRDEQGLSQEAAAAALGVSKRTIASAEGAPAASLPRSFRRATWPTKRPTPALPPPVEGKGSQGDG